MLSGKNNKRVRRRFFNNLQHSSLRLIGHCGDIANNNYPTRRTKGMLKKESSSTASGINRNYTLLIGKNLDRIDKWRRGERKSPLFKKVRKHPRKCALPHPRVAEKKVCVPHFSTFCEFFK